MIFLRTFPIFKIKNIILNRRSYHEKTLAFSFCVLCRKPRIPRFSVAPASARIHRLLGGKRRQSARLSRHVRRNEKRRTCGAAEENLTYKEDDLYANAYVLDQIETLENRDFSVYLLFDLNTDTLYGYRRILFVENPTDADCKLPEKLLNTLTAQYGEPTTYPGLENRISTHLDRLSTDAVGSGEVYNEYWSVYENCDASLGVSFLPDGRLFVDIVCQTPRT